MRHRLSMRGAYTAKLGRVHLRLPVKRATNPARVRRPPEQPMPATHLTQQGH